jgi:hypothetical protein
MHSGALYLAVPVFVIIIIGLAVSGSLNLFEILKSINVSLS